MLHLSEVLNLPVYDAKGSRVGRLDDLRVDSVRCVVERIVVRSPRGGPLQVPWTSVETFAPENRRVILAEGDIPRLPEPPETELLNLRSDSLQAFLGCRSILGKTGKHVPRPAFHIPQVHDLEVVLAQCPADPVGRIRHRRDKHEDRVLSLSHSLDCPRSIEQRALRGTEVVVLRETAE